MTKTKHVLLTSVYLVVIQGCLALLYLKSLNMSWTKQIRLNSYPPSTRSWSHRPWFSRIGPKNFLFIPTILKHERLILVHIDLFHYYFSFIYFFIFACNVDLEKFLSLQKGTFGKSARLKFKLLIDKYKI